MMRPRAPLNAALIAGLGLLLSCATAPAPFQSAPAPATPENWSATPGPAGEIDMNWLASFDDPTLNTLIAEALSHNAELDAAAARLSQAVSAARIAGADRWPQAGAGLSSSRRRMNFIGLPVPGAQGGVFSTTNSTYGVSLDLSWEIDLWGRIRAGERAALADLRAATAALEGARLSLAAQTAKAWFALREATAQLALAHQTALSFERARENVSRRYRRGLSPALDLRLSRGNAASARARLATRQQRRDAAARQLEILLGRFPSAELLAKGELPKLPPQIPAGLPAQLVARRPDLVIAESRLAAAGARVRQARAALYPRLSLTASGGTSTTELKDLLDADFKVWNVAANLLQPIFQGGRLRANLRLNKARVREAADAFTSALLRAYGEVETGLAAEHFLAEHEQALAEATRQTIAARKLADEQYRAGLIGILPVLEAQRRALQAESEWISVRRERLVRRIDLHLALGGSFVLPSDVTTAETSPADDVATDHSAPAGDTQP